MGVYQDIISAARAVALAPGSAASSLSSSLFTSWRPSDEESRDAERPNYNDPQPWSPFNVSPHQSVGDTPHQQGTSSYTAYALPPAIERRRPVPHIVKQRIARGIPQTPGIFNRVGLFLGGALGGFASFMLGSQLGLATSLAQGHAFNVGFLTQALGWLTSSTFGAVAGNMNSELVPGWAVGAGLGRSYASTRYPGVYHDIDIPPSISESLKPSPEFLQRVGPIARKRARDAWDVIKYLDKPDRMFTDWRMWVDILIGN
jgi:hypothetical protein